MVASRAVLPRASRAVAVARLGGPDPMPKARTRKAKEANKVIIATNWGGEYVLPRRGSSAGEGRGASSI